MTDLARSAASRTVEEMSGPANPPRGRTEPTAVSGSTQAVTFVQRATMTDPRAARWRGVLAKVSVRVLVALGLALLAFVFLEAWLPGVVVHTLGSWLSG